MMSSTVCPVMEYFTLLVKNIMSLDTLMCLPMSVNQWIYICAQRNFVKRVGLPSDLKSTAFVQPHLYLGQAVRWLPMLYFFKGTQLTLTVGPTLS